MFAIASLSISAHADDFPAFTPIPVGYISYDVTGADVAQFDIVNFTGGNASTFPDMSFPISTPLSLTNLSPDGQLSRRSINRLRLLVLHLFGLGWTLPGWKTALNSLRLSNRPVRHTQRLLFSQACSVHAERDAERWDRRTGLPQKLQRYDRRSQRIDRTEISPSSTPSLHAGALHLAACSEQVCS